MYHQTSLQSWLFLSVHSFCSLSPSKCYNRIYSQVWHNIRSTRTSLHACQNSVLSCVSLLYVRHHKINIWFQPAERDGSGALWCQYRDQFSRRFSLYTALSWLEIPQPTLVNTPTDLKTNCAGADKHAGQSRLYSKWQQGHYRVNALIDSNPSQSYSKHRRYHERRAEVV